uniref:leucine-rich repeat-containing protein 43-like n=1 Tax=Centroberyx gerrardi TaxID=166262 RepID=UPI003AABAA05
MGSQTLSSVLEQQLRSLCLSDFPCGHGSWRKTNGGRSKEESWGYAERDEGRAGADSEEPDALVDLLTCPRSPWHQEASWSPEAPALRELCVLTPQRLDGDFIFKYFSTLRIVDKGVSVIDDGLLKFSNLEELVLSANNVSELPAGHFPHSLRILELRANRLCGLDSLSNHQLPRLQYLGLGSNNLGSLEDIHHLTGKHWPKLVSLDLSGCEFEAQRVLVEALATLPCLRTLLLEGNPLTLAPSYPGFTLDALPRLLYLDASRVTPEERHRFRGLAEMRDLIADGAAAAVGVRRMRGIPDPQMIVDDSTPDFPVVTYSYFVTYEFLSHEASDNKRANSESVFDAVATAHAKEDDTTDADQQSNKNSEHQSSVTNTSNTADALMMNKQEKSHDTTQVWRHSTSKLAWAECMDFTHTSSHVVGDLGSFKRFLSRGLCLGIEEEKVLSWPAPSVEVPEAKPSQTPKEKKGGKGKEAPSKAGSKDKSKDKKKKCVTDLVQDAPVRRTLGSAHVPLHSLLTGSQRVDVLCDLGVLLTEPGVAAVGTLEKDPAKKIKEDKKKEEKKLKSRGDSAAGQRNTAASKGKGKGRKESEVDVHTDDTASIQLEPMTVEFSVQLEKWPSASEARQLLLPH